MSPAISIDQKTTSRNPRSTVGTVTEIYDYLRLLFARVGHPHCPKCGKPVNQQSLDQMLDQLLALPERTKLLIMAQAVRGKKGEHKKFLEHIRKEGYTRLRIDGEIRDAGEEIQLEKNKKHTIEVVIDRLIIRPEIRPRMAESMEVALKMGQGVAYVQIVDGEQLMFSQNFACEDCGISLPEITPRMFSFNSPFGACPVCSGLGSQMEMDLELVLPDKTKSLAEGAIAPMSTNVKGYYMRQMDALVQKYGCTLDTPWQEMPAKLQQKLLYGTGEEILEFGYENMFGQYKIHRIPFEGVMNILNRRYRESESDTMREEYENYMSVNLCPECHGARLKPEVLAVTIGGKNIQQVTDMPVAQCQEFFQQVEFSDRERTIGQQVLKEIQARLGFLAKVGLEYLTLSRAAGTLSGGEAQRIRLATQIGSGLVGVLYILDEPSIGLHQRDNNKLLEALKNLRNMGNTLLVVEHDEDTMRVADHIVDIGPGAGSQGGYVVAQGTAEEIMAVPESVTGQYLSHKKIIPVPEKRRQGNGNFLEILGAEENNLKNVHLKLPLGVFTVITGVSGSGKSTLINEILYKAVASKLYRIKGRPGKFKKLLGMENVDKVIDIDQSPIGRTPRSNPATYTGVFDLIRTLFSQCSEAKMRGYKPGRFSFNIKGGRCETCKGDGIIKIEMHFLSDVYVPCEVCGGARYNQETLEVKYKGKSIADVLDMTIEEAVEFFKNVPRIANKLQVLQDVGLGYVKLGQSATTLSGGEAQRVKLATELSRRSTGKTLYILDEPTTGLHTADIHRLLEILQRLVDGGDSVVVIEHNLDVIKSADYIVDLGPEGGDKGGTIVAQGTPEEIVKVKASYTGKFLKHMLEQ